LDVSKDKNGGKHELNGGEDDGSYVRIPTGPPEVLADCSFYQGPLFSATILCSSIFLVNVSTSKSDSLAASEIS